MKFQSIFKLVPGFVLFINLVSPAESDASFNLIRTKTIDGCYIGVVGSNYTTNDTPSSDKLNFCIFRSATNDNRMVYQPTAHEYIYQIELIDSNGIALPKTALGNQVGSKYFNLKPSLAIGNGYDLRRWPAMSEPGWGGTALFFPTRPGFGGQTTHSADDLFVITQPGSYKLCIHFQIITRDGTKSNQLNVVRFPRLDYPLVKQ